MHLNMVTPTTKIGILVCKNIFYERFLGCLLNKFSSCKDLVLMHVIIVKAKLAVNAIQILCSAIFR